MLPSNHILSKPLRSRFSSLVFIALLQTLITISMLLSANIAHCFDRSFAWDANTEPDIAGYRIYYKIGVSGPPYDGIGANEGDSPIQITLANLNDPANPEFTLHGLSGTGTSRFVSTAYDIYGNESNFSNELVYQPSEPNNVAPVVSAGSDQTIILPINNILLEANVTDDGLPNSTLNFQWSQVSGPGTVTFGDANAEDTAAMFPVSGLYVLRLTVDDTELSANDDIQVTVSPEPVSNFAPNSVIDTPPSEITITVGDAVDFTGTGTDSDGDYPFTYLWEFGTGSGIGDMFVEDPGIVQFDQVGTFTVRFTVTDDLGLADQTPAEVVVIVSDPNNVSMAGAEIVRINAGGGDYTDGNGNLWSADYGYNTGNVFSTTNAISGTTDDTLYQRERWDSGGSPELMYSFDVPNGDYTVNLLFDEAYSGTFGVGLRVFDVLIEGQPVSNDLDIYSEAGSNAALVKSYPVTVSDGQLNIEFLHVVENPKVNAIEVISTGTDADPPSIPTGLSGNPVSSTQIDLTWSASTDTGGSGLAGYRVYRNGIEVGTTAVICLFKIQEMFSLIRSGHLRCVLR